MTLREMMANRPGLFYTQTWYMAELFVDKEPTNYDWPRDVRRNHSRASSQYSAADIARFWLLDKHREHNRMWDRYLWTCDVDSLGQRVYIGQNGRGLEIHRHLHLTERWGVPV